MLWPTATTHLPKLRSAATTAVHLERVGTEPRDAEWHQVPRPAHPALVEEEPAHARLEIHLQGPRSRVAGGLDETGGRLDALFNNGAYALPGAVIAVE